MPAPRVVGSEVKRLNAVMDARAPLGITSLDMPLRPEKIWRAIRQARTG